MKRFFGSLAATAALLFATAPSSAAIVITEVHSTGSSNATYIRDFFELTNTGASAVDISGWKVDDSSNAFASAIALFDVTSIAPGQSVVFTEFSTTESAANHALVYDAFKAAWFGSNVPSGFTMGGYSGSQIGLSGTADAVNIFDSLGVPVPGANVSFGLANVGTTFDNAAGLSGAITQQSVVGVNGAFTSFTGGEIGSPGSISAVPEPSTWALMLCGMGGLGLVIRRRSQR